MSGAESIHVSTSSVEATQDASPSNDPPSPAMPYTPSSTNSHRLGAILSKERSSVERRRKSVPHSSRKSHDDTGGAWEMTERGGEDVMVIGGDPEEDGDDPHKLGREEVNVTRPDVLPPSPPLTRVPTNESGRQSLQRQHEPEPHTAGHATEDTDITHLNASPPTQRRSSSPPDSAGHASQGDQDKGDENASDALNDDELEESHSSSAPHPLHHHHDMAQTGSLYPWEDVDPPAANNEGLSTTVRSDMYSTFGSRQLNAALQNGDSIPRRPLIPHSSYYFGPPQLDSAYGTDPMGHIGVHHPREIVRVERDYTGGDIPQFSSAYPLELEGRLTPTQFLETINSINELLISAHDLKHSAFENALAACTLYLSRLIIKSHYEKEMGRLRSVIEALNMRVYNPAGLHILWPRAVAFMFLEIEYY